MITMLGWVFMISFLVLLVCLFVGGLVALSWRGWLARWGGGTAIVVAIMGLISWVNILAEAFREVPL